jgi:hypothetical protein
MRVYLAGPMSGLPQFNFPAFYAATAALRAEGFEVISPAELDDQEDKGAALKSADGNPANAKRTWGEFLSRDVKVIADQGVEGIVFLPNWYKSRGARLEATVGLLQKNFSFFDYVEEKGMPQITKLNPSFVAWCLYEANLKDHLAAYMDPLKPAKELSDNSKAVAA